VNELQSSCEIAAVSPTAPSGSRIARFLPDFAWQGVPVAAYKPEGGTWCGIKRMTLVGEQGESTRFHLRYFEIAPGGFSSLEQHVHEHAVVVLRGRGQVQLGGQAYDVQFGDTVYVAPNEPHQFRNSSASEAFGFLCVVDAERDRPVVIPPDQVPP
jgi:ribulose-bisphosphate carboxylase large chain